MGFSWTSIIVGDITLDDIIDEIQTNVETVYSDLALDPPSWTELPVNVEDLEETADYQDIRTKIDYADDMNYCHSHNTDHDGADNADADASVYTGQNTGYDSGYKAGVDSNYDSDVKSTHNSSVDSAHKGSACGPVNTGVQNDYYGTYWYTHYVGN